MAKRQVKSGTTEHEQLKVTVGDIDQRTISTAAAIAVYQEHDEKRKKAEAEAMEIEANSQQLQQTDANKKAGQAADDATLQGNESH